MLIFLTGLTTGGLSCLAVQGGLLTSLIANQKEDELEKTTKKEAQVNKKVISQNQPGVVTPNNWLPVSLFLIAKLLAYIVLGFFLGWIGERLALTFTVRLLFQGLAALFMLGTAFNLLNVHPFFRYFLLQPPRFIRKWLKKTSRSQTLFAPAFLGSMTIFMPCGVTQSMEVLAISTGNPLVGAMIMGIFVLGTSPLFAVIGIATAKLSDAFQDKFMKLAAVSLIYLSLVSLNGILVVLNSPLSFQTITHPITYFFSEERFQDAAKLGNLTPTKNNVQSVSIQVNNNGYTPKSIKVKAGIPVELTVSTNETYSCASSFILKAFDIKMQLGPTDSQTVVFTPDRPGKYQFTCSMGMYSGTLEVI